MNLQSPVEGLAHKLAEVKAETIYKTLILVKAQAIVEALPDTLGEVKS